MPLVLLLFSLALPAPPGLPKETGSRVRPDDESARAIVLEGANSSQTVAGLIADIEASDVIVYIRTSYGLPRRGMLTFLAHGGDVTYVLVRLDPHGSVRQRVATLAHELTHVVEVAHAQPPVSSAADLERLYSRIGLPGDRSNEFESMRAMENERQARKDLAHGVR